MGGSPRACLFTSELLANEQFLGRRYDTGSVEQLMALSGRVMMPRVRVALTLAAGIEAGRRAMSAEGEFWTIRISPGVLGTIAGSRPRPCRA